MGIGGHGCSHFWEPVEFPSTAMSMQVSGGLVGKLVDISPI